MNRPSRPGNLPDYLAANHAFHFALYEAAEAPVLLDLARSLWLRAGPSLAGRDRPLWPRDRPGPAPRGACGDAGGRCARRLPPPSSGTSSRAWTIPRIMSGGQPAELKCGAEKCLVPPVHYFDLPWQEPNFVTIAAINIADENEAIGSEVWLVEANNTMYASLNNLYLISTKYRSEDELYAETLKRVMLKKLTAEESARIIKIEAVDDLILSPAEKSAKIRQALEYFLRQRTGDVRNAIAKEVETAFKADYPDLGSILVRERSSTRSRSIGDRSPTPPKAKCPGRC